MLHLNTSGVRIALSLYGANRYSFNCFICFFLPFFISLSLSLSEACKKLMFYRSQITRSSIWLIWPDTQWYSRKERVYSGLVLEKPNSHFPPVTSWKLDKCPFASGGIYGASNTKWRTTLNSERSKLPRFSDWRPHQNKEHDRSTKLTVAVYSERSLAMLRNEGNIEYEYIATQYKGVKS